MLKLNPDVRSSVFMSGLSGIITYLIIDGLAEWLERRQEARAKLCADTVKCSGIVGFMYLELIDASFSLDGVLGAFALSKDILIITIGLCIGAMFVRSLTIMLVEKKTLDQYLYLEHGAHWAIGTLAILMFVSTFHEVPEVVTGVMGLAFIVGALISSVIHNNKVKKVSLKDENLYFIGGVVRDEMLGIPSLDTDYCYEGDAIEFAKQKG